MITTALKNLLPSALLLAVAATPAAATVTWEFVETSVDNGVPPPVPFSPHIAGTLSMSDTDFLNGGIFYSATFTIDVVNGLGFNGAFAIEYAGASASLGPSTIVGDTDFSFHVFPVLPLPEAGNTDGIVNIITSST